MTAIYHVTGLCCIEEVKALRRTVGGIDGVASLDFNLMKGTIRVEFSRDPVPDAVILAAIKAAGLEGIPISAGADQGTSGDSRSLRRLQVFCACSGLFTLSGIISHGVLHQGFMHALTGSDAGMAQAIPRISLFFYLAAILTGGRQILPKAMQAARRLQPDMNLLMTVAVIGAMAIGEWFEAATVTFLFALSLLLESWSMERARRAVEALLDLSPLTARCLLPHHEAPVELQVAEILPETIIQVRPGERIPLDGIILRGTTAVNLAPLTGESIPVGKEPGDEVYAGTINETGTIDVLTTRAAADTRLAHIIHLVEEAQSRRAPTEQWIERFARRYTPVMMAAALLVALAPPLVMGGGWEGWFYQALVLLVIACPCALVISTPVSIVAALAAAARAGVLVKGGAYLEAVAGLKAVAFDKTGTITLGRPEVQSVVPMNDHTETELLACAAAMEAHSDHPLARAILRRAAEAGITAPDASDYVLIRGKGAEAVINGQRFWLGNHRLMHEKGTEHSAAHAAAEAMADAGHSIVAIGTDDHICGVISVADTVRPDAAATVAWLRNSGIEKIVLLTGDNNGTARAVGKEVGFDDVHAELLPKDKVQVVENLVGQHGPTAMVGDGINDAPALARATVGIAMGGAGSDAAVETADIALMSDDIGKLPWLVAHARKTLRIIRQNIAFALGMKTLFMLLAIGQFATLWLAIAADTGAALLVTANALRLLNKEGGRFRGTSRAGTAGKCTCNGSCG